VHGTHALIPTFDHLATAQHKVKRLPAIDRAVEFYQLASPSVTECGCNRSLGGVTEHALAIRRTHRARVSEASSHARAASASTSALFDFCVGLH
jgi:hypothetical protein